VKTGLKQETSFNLLCKAVIISNYANSGQFSLNAKLDKFLGSGTSGVKGFHHRITGYTTPFPH